MDLKNYKQIINGKMVDPNNLTIPSGDIGFLRGYGVFEYLITYNNKPFHLESHLKRLYRSADIIGLEINYSIETINEWVSTLLNVNNDGLEKSIRIIVTGGDLIGVLGTGDKNLAMVMVGDRPKWNDKLYELGGSAISVEYERPYPESKTLNYLDGVVRFKKCADKNLSEAIYYSKKQVHEGVTTNVFAVINGVLTTPKNNILYGITREIILNNLKLNSGTTNIALETRDFSIEELKKATEIFITSSTREALPITKLDGKLVGDGNVGVITKSVMRAYKEYVLTMSNF